MNTQFSYKFSSQFAQAYGVESYGQQQYGYCEQTPDGCTPVNTSTATPPNTGFLGLSSDAAVASLSGALLVAIAIAGAVYVVLSRRKALKKKDEK